MTALVKSQGNQGAISLGTVLDDITELAGEGGGGGGGTPNVIQISSEDAVNWTIANPDDLETFAGKAEQGELVMIKASQQLNGQTVTVVTPAVCTNKMLGFESIAVDADGVSASIITIDVVQKTVMSQTFTYPS